MNIAHLVRWFTHEQWWCSIVMWTFTRGHLYIYIYKYITLPKVLEYQWLIHHFVLKWIFMGHHGSSMAMFGHQGPPPSGRWFGGTWPLLQSIPWRSWRQQNSGPVKQPHRGIINKYIYICVCIWYMVMLYDTYIYISIMHF